MKKYILATLIAAAGASAVLSAHATDERGAGEGAQGPAKRGAGFGAGGNGTPLQVIGLTDDQRLVEFADNQPGSARTVGSISGLITGDAVVGIDFRVQDGKLYGVTKTGGIYVIDQTTAQATKVSQLSVALEGSSYGVDFNPAADRLRVVSNTGQNLRHNVNAGGTTLVDDPLDYPPATTLNAVGPSATGVTASAYTNNDLEAATGTTLYAIDINLDQLALQSPPNDGTLASTGKLGADIGDQVGFDIYSTVRDGVTTGVEALASVSSDSGPAALFAVNLASGNLRPLGNFPGQDRVIGIAIPLAQR